jgi:uncharacterized protein (DUF302 family)
MTTQTVYGFGTTTPLPYREAIQRVTDLLKEEGFGILTQIDVRKTMKEKLGAEFRDYVILGACNPRLAHDAFAAELEIGLLLPCNVIVYAGDGGTVVSVMDPVAALGIVGNTALRPVAEEARRRLERVIQKLGTGGARGSSPAATPPA